MPEQHESTKSVPTRSEMVAELEELREGLDVARGIARSAEGLSVDRLLRCVEAELFMVGHALDEDELEDAALVLAVARTRLRTIEGFLRSLGGRA